jgi:hypothetical protein
MATEGLRCRGYRPSRRADLQTRRWARSVSRTLTDRANWMGNGQYHPRGASRSRPVARIQITRVAIATRNEHPRTLRNHLRSSQISRHWSLPHARRRAPTTSREHCAQPPQDWLRPCRRQYRRRVRWREPCCVRRGRARWRQEAARRVERDLPKRALRRAVG